MSKQIDLEKLRRLATEANTPEQWYLESDLTSCSYSYDKAFIAEFSPSVAMELLDHIAALEKDAARYRWLRGKGKYQQETYMYCCDDELDSEIDEDLKSRHAIDTAMEASNAKAD